MNLKVRGDFAKRIVSFEHRKKIIQPNFAFPPLHHDFFRLLTATSIDHWVLEMLISSQ